MMAIKLEIHGYPWKQNVPIIYVASKYTIFAQTSFKPLDEMLYH